MIHPRIFLLLLAAPSLAGMPSAQHAALAPPLSLQRAELAGRSLVEYPYFEHVSAFAQGSTVEIAIDPYLLPQLAGRSVDLYVTATRTRAQWLGNPVLVDVTGGPQTFFIASSSIQDNRFSVDVGTLGADAGPFRACQATRHPRTTATLGDMLFSVRLRDAFGVTSDISIGAYGGGIEEPYQRSSCGTGAGWNNEWETIRIRLGDFLHSTPSGPPGGFGLDLRDVVAVEPLFGPSFGSPSARLGLDELQLE